MIVVGGASSGSGGGLTSEQLEDINAGFQSIRRDGNNLIFTTNNGDVTFDVAALLTDIKVNGATFTNQVLTLSVDGGSDVQVDLSEFVTSDELTNHTHYSYFCIWAEESADLGNGAFEWAYGNGNETPNGMGVVVPFDCELFSVGLTLEGAATCKVEVYKNTGGTGKFAETSNSKKAISIFEGSTIAFTAQDVINFRTITGHASSNGGVAVAWFRKQV